MQINNDHRFHNQFIRAESKAKDRGRRNLPMMRACAAKISRKLLQHQQNQSFEFRALTPSLISVNLSTTMNTAQFPVEASIIQKLEEGLEPTVLKVINESHMHNV